MLFSRKIVLALGAAAGLALSPTSASASLVFDGVEFPQGEISFADSVVEYNVGIPGPLEAFRGLDNALGAPDYNNDPACRGGQDACTFLTLGRGGSVVLRFTDNLLTGSGTSALDLWVFEIGDDVEDTDIDISMDGVNWEAVGRIGGGTSGVDIDAFGFGTTSQFSWVRLTDVASEGQQSGNTVGADIDAVGAISTVAAAIPEPSTWMVMLLGFFGVGAALRHSGRRNLRAEWA